MSNTIYIHPDAHAAMLKAGDVLAMEGAVVHDRLYVGMEYRISKYVPAMYRKQVRKPRSKKKRIQNKWAENPRNWVDLNVAYLVDDSKSFLRPLPVGLSDIPFFQTFGTNDLPGLERDTDPRAIVTGIQGV